MKIKILIADSVSTMRENMKTILENEGFTNILEADNGESACEIFENELPQIVIMDIAVPGKSGMESLRDMMKINPGSSVIICSAASHRELVIEAFKLGAADFILKPLKPERLIQSVKKAYDNI